ncbi:putative DNA binding domain-containing protein [Methanomassiliicoccales archaeon LGM-DZ1]|nr:putative DNA binding domain-containing protein [Methanomassiliicoccales archaeon LGM-DZ1]
MLQEDLSTDLEREYSIEVLKTAVAFSNGSGGRIVIGIDSGGTAAGLPDPEKVRSKCAREMAGMIMPDISAASRISIESIDDKDVVSVDVSEGACKPYRLCGKNMSQNGIYVRVGTFTVPTGEGLFRHLEHKEYSSRYGELISLRQDLTFDYLKKVSGEKKLELDADRMEALHMVRGGKYTNLAFILSDQFDQPIKMASYPDHHKSRFIDREIADGSALEQAEKAIKYIMDHNRTVSTIAGIYRQDTLQFPEAAVREAVLNAVVHRDYSREGTILISIYPDCLTIVSPGELYTYYTESDLFSGVSSLRNRNLANVMYRLELIESFGTGLPRIMDKYMPFGLTPSVKSGSSIFTITLPAIGSYLDRTDSFLMTHSTFTRQELQDTLGMSRNEAVAKIRELSQQGRITKYGAGKSTRYMPTGTEGTARAKKPEGD